MRTLSSFLFISLDGVVESPDQWQFDHFDEDMGAAMAQTLDAQDAVLMGRTTYDEWAGYWPTSTDEPFASYINNVPKYVVSDSLDSADWENTTVVRGADLAARIAELKAAPGKTIGVAGSPTLVRSLIDQDLLDELFLAIHPVVAGSGARLFVDGDPRRRFDLAESTTTATGVTLARFRPRRD